jgi:hypothetical protein
MPPRPAAAALVTVTDDVLAAAVELALTPVSLT